MRDRSSFSTNGWPWSFDVVDLSTDLTCHSKGPFETKMEVLEAASGATFFCETVLPRLAPIAVGRLEPHHFPGAAFLRHELVTASVHAGSHVDAPGHYGPSTKGDGGWINDAPPEQFVGQGVVISAADEVQMLATVESTAAARGDMTDEIVLLDARYEGAILPDAVHCLLDHGVRVIGTNGASFDGPFAPMIDRFLVDGDSSVLWPAHMLGRDRPYYQIERLRNLDKLPADGFLVVAAPIKIEGATAAWTRALAFVPRDDADQG